MNLAKFPRRHPTTAVVMLTVCLGVGWTSRELGHAQEKARLLESTTINRADIKISDFMFEGTPRGQVGIYLEGATEGTRNCVTGVFHLRPGLEPHPIHKHIDEEIMIITAGQGEIHCAGKTTKVGPGSVMYTGPHAPHGITNTGKEDLTFYFVKWIAKGN